MNKTFQFILIFLGLILLASPAFAQQILDRDLKNGLKVIVIPNANVPLVTIEISVKNGAFTETPRLDGLSHLYEHMFFKGNEKFPNQELYMKKVRQLGMEFNGTTSAERVNYFYTLPSENLRQGLDFMFAAISTLKFDPIEFEKEKQVVIGEIDRNESNPYYWLNQSVSSLLWYKYPARKNALGSRKSVQDATISQMKKMKATYYVPNNSALVIAGDVDPEKAFALAKEYFSSWKRVDDPFIKNPTPKHPPLLKNAYTIVEKDVRAATFRLSWHGPSVNIDPKATFAADVLSYILMQPTSKFQKALTVSGATLGASLSYFTQKTTGPIELYIQIPPDKLKTSIPLVMNELENFTLPNYFTDAQLESAKNILAIEDLYSREKTSTYAQTVSFWWATAGLDYYRNYISNLRSITRADINRYVTQYISGKYFVASLLLSTVERNKLGMTTNEFKSIVENTEK